MAGESFLVDSEWIDRLVLILRFVGYETSVGLSRLDVKLDLSDHVSLLLVEVLHLDVGYFDLGVTSVEIHGTKGHAAPEVESYTHR